jgi:sodium transport system permease protein
VPRDRILLGKLMATAAFSLASLVLGLLAFLLAGKFMPTAELGLSLALGPRFFAVALPMLLPLVLLVCVAQVLIAAYARSVREAQTYLGLAQLVPLIPSVVLSVVPIKAQLWMYAVPLLGQQLALMRLLRAEPLAGFALALSALGTLLAVVLLFLLARRNYESERLAVAG